MKIAAVIFDMNGLMLDTGRSIRSRGSERRQSAVGEAILEEAFGTTFRLERFRAACARCDAEAFADDLPAMKPGLDAPLALIESRGIPKGVATSKAPSAEVAALADVKFRSLTEVAEHLQSLQEFHIDVAPGKNNSGAPDFPR